MAGCVCARPYGRYGVQFEHDVVMADSADRKLKAQRNTLFALQELADSCAAAIRNYSTMSRYVYDRRRRCCMHTLS